MSAKPYIILESCDLKIFDLSEIGKVLAEYTNNSDLLLLSGKVGAGKTEFARLIIKAKAIKENFDIEDETPELFNSDIEENLTEETLDSKDNDKIDEDDLEIPAFLRRQKN